METQKIKYQKTQISKWILAVLAVGFPLLITSYILKWGNNPISEMTFALVLLLLIVIVVLFYKLTITIDDKNISAVFGIGLIKKNIPLNEIQIESIEEIKIPWYTGIGIRVTKYGVLYNTKSGMAIRIKSKADGKTFLVGTDDYEKIRIVLLENIQ